MGKPADPTRNPARARERCLRTCVGCRERAAAADLLRVTVTSSAVESEAGPQRRLRLVPDPRRRLPGRGAHVHYDRDCVATAIRRRAFARALRVPQTPDPDALWEYITQQIG